MRRLFDWARPRPQALPDSQQFLLSLFLRPRDTVTITGGGWGQLWAEKLGEPPARTIGRLTAQRYLQPASTAEALTVVHGLDSLRQALRARGVKVSGRKAELVARLLEADPRQCQVDVRGHGILICTALGAEVGERYARGRAEAREAAVCAALDHVRRRRFDDAGQALRRFNDREVFPPGIGLSPAGIEAVHRETLHHLFAGGLPKILGAVKPEAAEHLMIAGAMALLGVEGAHKKHLPPALVSGSHLSDEAAVRMVTFAAIHRRNMGQIAEAEITHVRIAGVGDGSGCEACAALRERTFSLVEAPELPYADCMCDVGCRCRAMAVL